MDTPSRLLSQHLVLNVYALCQPSSTLPAVCSSATSVTRNNLTLRAWTDHIVFKSKHISTGQDPLAMDSRALPLSVDVETMPAGFLRAMLQVSDHRFKDLDQAGRRKWGNRIMSHVRCGEPFDLVKLGLEHQLFSDENLGEIIAAVLYAPLTSITQVVVDMLQEAAHVARDRWRTVFVAATVQLSQSIPEAAPVLLINYMLEHDICPAQFAFTSAGAFSDVWLVNYLTSLPASSLATFKCTRAHLDQVLAMITDDTGRFNKVYRYGIVLHYLNLNIIETPGNQATEFPYPGELSLGNLDTLIVLSLSALSLYTQGKLRDPERVSKFLPRLTKMWLSAAANCEPVVSTFTSNLTKPYLAATKRFVARACRAWYREYPFDQPRITRGPVSMNGREWIEEFEDDEPLEASEVTPEVERAFDCLLQLDRPFVVDNMKWNQHTAYWVWAKVTAEEVAENMLTIDAAARAVYSTAVDEASEGIYEVLSKVPQEFVRSHGFATMVAECLDEYEQSKWDPDELVPDVYEAVDEYLAQFKSKRRGGKSDLSGHPRVYDDLQMLSTLCPGLFDDYSTSDEFSDEESDY